MEGAQKQAIQTRTPLLHDHSSKLLLLLHSLPHLGFFSLMTANLGGIKRLSLWGIRSQLTHFSGVPSNAGVAGDYELLPLRGRVNYPGHALIHKRQTELCLSSPVVLQAAAIPGWIPGSWRVSSGDLTEMFCFTQSWSSDAKCRCDINLFYIAPYLISSV